MRLASCASCCTWVTWPVIFLRRMFEDTNTNIRKVLPAILPLYLVQVRPPSENTRSLAAEVAVMHRYFRASCPISPSSTPRSLQNTSGYSTQRMCSS